MRRTPKLALIGAAALALPLLSTPAVAQHYDGGLEVTCKQVVLQNTGAHVLDRDNTGTGRENFRVRAYDGAAELIAFYPEQVVRRILGHRDPRSTRRYAEIARPTANGSAQPAHRREQQAS